MPEAAKYLTKEEVKRLFKVIRKPRDRAIFAVSYFRGLRASEIGKLQMSGLKLGTKRLFVRRLKGSIAAEFLLSDLEVKLLRAWIKERGEDPGPIFLSNRRKGIGRGQIYVLMQKYCQEAGISIDRAHPHVLKHSLGTHLLQGGMSLLKVKSALGHKKLSSTEHYLHLADNELDEAASEFYSKW
jgi:integrase/recombinase XerD